MSNSTPKAWYDNHWLVALLCVFFFPVGLYALWKGNFGKGWKVGVSLLIGLLVIAGLSDPDKNKPTKDSASAPVVPVSDPKEDDAASATGEVAAEPATNWAYETSEDKMTGEKSYFASATSNNKLEFEFPYNGGSTGSLVVRNMGNGNNVLLMIDKGQFMSSFGGNEYVRIKFDEEAPFKVSYSQPSDHSTTTIFLGSESKIIGKLKKAKKVMIEAPFFQAGRQMLEFSVDGLEWKK